MRVAHLVPNMAVGGRERLVSALCHAGEKDGLEPLVIGYDPLPDSTPTIALDVPYYQLNRRDRGFNSALADLIAQEHVQVLHAQGHIPACYATGVDVPKLATMHIGMAGTWRWGWAVRRSLRAMNALFAVSRPMADQYERVCGAGIGVIPNGIDLDRFAAAPCKEYRKEGPFRFGMLSRLHPVKRHIDTVAAADQLVKRGKRIELHIAGDGPMQAKLEALAAKRPWLHLHGPVEDTPAFLSSLHALVLPSDHEGMPMAMLEAMASGLPVIASNLESLRQIGGNSALYVKRRKPGQLAGAMEQMVGDPTAWRWCSSEARTRAAAHSITKAAERYAHIYRQLAAH